jgi:hypothetical protein
MPRASTSRRQTEAEKAQWARRAGGPRVKNAAGDVVSSTPRPRTRMPAVDDALMDALLRRDHEYFRRRLDLEIWDNTPAHRFEAVCTRGHPLAELGHDDENCGTDHTSWALQVHIIAALERRRGVRVQAIEDDGQWFMEVTEVTPGEVRRNGHRGRRES